MRTPVLPSLATMRSTARVDALNWLADVREVTIPLTAEDPILVKVQDRADDALPGPQSHPCCEFNFQFRGTVVNHVGAERVVRPPGDVGLYAPGTPHYGIQLKGALECAVVYFSPSVLLEATPRQVGVKLLERFTAAQTIRDRIVRPPPVVQRRMAGLFRQMIAESSQKPFGYALRLRGLLVGALLELVRWEQSASRQVGTGHPSPAWAKIEQALAYLHEHYGEQVYAEKVAAAAGVSVTQLREMFRRHMGLPWVKYLQAYRINAAAVMLQTGKKRVTDIAFEVGFDDLSHFIRTFREHMGISPSEYQHR